MSDRYISQIIDDGGTITVVAHDEDGNGYSSTMSYNGSPSERDKATEYCSYDALNKD